jgi:hypothetical protein
MSSGTIRVIVQNDANDPEFNGIIRKSDPLRMRHCQW